MNRIARPFGIAVTVAILSSILTTFPFANSTQISDDTSSPMSEIIDRDSEKAQIMIREFGAESEDGFDKALSSLESEASGALIELYFKKFYRNPHLYLSMMREKYIFTAEHAPQWCDEIGGACEAAAKGNWKETEAHATTGLKDNSEIPLLLFVRAMAEKKQNKNALALTDLVRLMRVKALLKNKKTYNQNFPDETRNFFDFLVY